MILLLAFIIAVCILIALIKALGEALIRHAPLVSEEAFAASPQGFQIGYSSARWRPANELYSSWANNADYQAGRKAGLIDRDRYLLRTPVKAVAFAVALAGLFYCVFTAMTPVPDAQTELPDAATQPVAAPITAPVLPYACIGGFARRDGSLQCGERGQQ